MAEAATDLRQRIVRAAAELLTRDGREAVSTRAVCAAADVQAPAIYRQFSDMQALLRAAAHEVLREYVRKKAQRKPSDDPVEELRHGWDTHVAFGLANPDAYTLMYGDTANSAAAPELREGNAVLQALISRVAEAGRLRVTVPRAVALLHAAGSGVILSLIAQGPGERDESLSDAMREIVFGAILSSAPAKAEPGKSRVAARAVALRAVLREAHDELSPNEQLLLGEWLDRLASARAVAEPQPKAKPRKRER